MGTTQRHRLIRPTSRWYARWADIALEALAVRQAITSGVADMVPLGDYLKPGLWESARAMPSVTDRNSGAPLPAKITRKEIDMELETNMSHETSNASVSTRHCQSGRQPSHTARLGLAALSMTIAGALATAAPASAAHVAYHSPSIIKSASLGRSPAMPPGVTPA
jgi:hypothetical protein